MLKKIANRDNQRLKQARRARDGGASEALMFVEGLRLAEEVLRSELKIEDVFISENLAKNQRGKQFLDKISHSNVLIAEVSETIFNSLADTKTSQGVVLLARKPDTGKGRIETALSKQARLPLVVLLHETNNPSNLGAILRTVEAVGAAGVILTRNSADVFSPKSLRGAMGAAFRLPLWANADFSEASDWARANNLISVAADVRAEKSYLEIDWRTPRLLIFGSEAHGLSQLELAEIEEKLKVPMENNVESLNLAVSCAVILFEARRQVNEKWKTEN